MRTRIMITKPQALLSALFLPVLVLLTFIALPAAATTPEPAPTILITGASTGHGLAFSEEYAELGWNVIATSRTPAKADRLNALARKYPNVVVEKLDIVNDEQIAALAETCRGKPIDVLMNNAAINTFRYGARRVAKTIDYEWL